MESLSVLMGMSYGAWNHSAMLERGSDPCYEWLCFSISTVRDTYDQQYLRYLDWVNSNNGPRAPLLRQYLSLEFEMHR